jgi:hypothetical protein
MKNQTLAVIAIVAALSFLYYNLIRSTNPWFYMSFS